MWRGSIRLKSSVTAPFVLRCSSNLGELKDYDLHEDVSQVASSKLFFGIDCVELLSGDLWPRPNYFANLSFEATRAKCRACASVPRYAP